MEEKQEFEFKIGQKVWYIRIDKANVEKTYRPNGVKIEELKIIGASQYKYCLNNDFFTTIKNTKKGSRRDLKFDTHFDNIDVSIRTGNHILDDGVFISYYSTKKPTKRTLNKMAASAAVKIEREYGFLFSGVKESIYELVNNFKF